MEKLLQKMAFNGVFAGVKPAYERMDHAAVAALKIAATLLGGVRVERALFRQRERPPARLSLTRARLRD